MKICILKCVKDLNRRHWKRERELTHSQYLIVSEFTGFSESYISLYQDYRVQRKRDDQSRQIILLLATAYLETFRCTRLRKCLVSIIIQSLVKLAKALRSIYGTHIFVIVSVYQGKLWADKSYFHKSQIFLSVSQCSLTERDGTKFLRSQKH